MIRYLEELSLNAWASIQTVVYHRWCYERYRSTTEQDTLPPKREPTPSLEALDGWVD